MLKAATFQDGSAKYYLTPRLCSSNATLAMVDGGNGLAAPFQRRYVNAVCKGIGNSNGEP